MNDPAVGKVKEELEELSSDPVARRLAYDRETQLRLWGFELGAARALGRSEGFADGRVEGKTEGKVEERTEYLLRLVERRCGSVAPRVRQLVETATPDELLAWTDALTDGASVDEVFGRA